MDPVINSQVQSPLFRVLTAVKTKAASFTHNIPDNVPPVSFTKLELEQYTNATSLGSTFKFRFPQYGYLGRVVLKFSLTTLAAGAGSLIESALPTNFIRSVSLKTHNKEIQRLYGGEIYARVLRLDDTERQAWLTGMQGYVASTMTARAPGNLVAMTT